MTIARWLLCLVPLAGTSSVLSPARVDEELAAALRDLIAARSGFEAQRATIDGSAERLASLLETLAGELPEPPPSGDTFADQGTDDLRKQLESHDAYLLALEGRKRAIPDGEELVQSLTKQVDGWPAIDENLAQKILKARGLLAGAKGQVDLGAVDAEQLELPAGRSLDEWIADLETPDAARAELSSAVEERRDALEAAREALAGTDPPDPEVLRRAHLERRVSEIFVLVAESEDKKRNDFLQQDPSIVRAELDKSVREWQTGSSSYPVVRARVVELRTTLAELQREWRELTAPEKADITEGNEHAELLAARAELAYAEALEDYRERRLELLERTRTASRELVEANLESHAPLISYADLLLRVRACVAVIDGLVAEGGEPTTLPFERGKLWDGLKKLVYDAAHSEQEIEDLELRLDDESLQPAATRDLALQREQV